MDRIEIAGLQIDAIVGVLEREQRTPQRVEVDLALELALEDAGESGALDRSVDYAAVADQVRFIAEHGRFRLIESLAVAALRWVLAPPLPEEGRAAVSRAEIAVRKPEILAGVCVPGVRMAREAGFTGPEVVVGTGVRERCLVQVPEGGVWRVVLEQGASLSSEDRAVWVAAGEVEAAGRHGPGSRLPRGTVVRAAGRTVLLVVGR